MRSWIWIRYCSSVNSAKIKTQPILVGQGWDWEWLYSHCQQDFHSAYLLDGELVKDQLFSEQI
uniref:Uncharacterized protein n=1 Tax=Anser brachyrhynchus TaxID=132585 RepID=A0A8B9CBV7_9AVES